MRPAVPLVGFMLLGAACGLNVVGTTDLDGGSSDAATEPETFVPGPRSCPDGEAGCAARLPSGWQAVIYSSTGGLCPSNFSAREYLIDPKPEPGACACNCAVSTTDPPVCTKGTLTGSVGSLGCEFGASTSTYANVSGACQPVSGKLGSYGKFGPMPLTPGGCTTTSVRNDPSAFTSTTARLCVPSTACLDEVCSGIAPKDFAACIIADGDQQCPAGPFERRTIVGETTELTCAGCAGCTTTGTCGNAFQRFFVDDNCVAPSHVRTVDGVCRSTGSPEVRSYRYEATVTSATCKATGAPEATFALAQLHTVCCR